MKCHFGDTAVPNTLYGFFLLPFPLFRNKLCFQLGRNIAILPLLCWCLLSQELCKNLKEIRKKKRRWHEAALGTAQIMEQGWVWQLTEWSAGTCHGLIQMKMLGNAGLSPRTWLFRVSASTQEFILVTKLAMWALLGAVPVRDSGSAQTDHSPGHFSTAMDREQKPATSTSLLLILLIKMKQTLTFPSH